MFDRYLSCFVNKDFSSCYLGTVMEKNVGIDDYLIYNRQDGCVDTSF